MNNNQSLLLKMLGSVTRESNQEQSRDEIMMEHTRPHKDVVKDAKSIKALAEVCRYLLALAAEVDTTQPHSR